MRVVAGAVVALGIVGLVVAEVTAGRGAVEEEVNEKYEEVLADYKDAELRIDHNLYVLGEHEKYYGPCEERMTEERCLELLAFAVDAERQYKCIDSILGQYGPFAPDRGRQHWLSKARDSERVVDSLVGADVSGIQVTDRSLPFKVKWGKGKGCSND